MTCLLSLYGALGDAGNELSAEYRERLEHGYGGHEGSGEHDQGTTMIPFASRMQSLRERGAFVDAKPASQPVENTAPAIVPETRKEYQSPRAKAIRRTVRRTGPEEAHPDDEARHWSDRLAGIGGAK